MMKKIVLGVTVAALVGVTSSCFALGLPKVPKVPGAAKPAAAGNDASAQAVDLSDLTSKQTNVLKYTAAGLLNAADGVIEVKKALKMDTTKDVAARSALEKEQSNKTVNELNKQISVGMPDKAAIDKVANGTEEQKAALKAALSKAETYKLASYISLGTAAVNAGKCASEATSALKSTKDMKAISKLNGMVKTFQLAGGMLPNIQKLYKEYDSNAASAKEALGVKQPSQADISKQAKDAEDGLGALQ